MPENKKWDIQVSGLGEKLKWYMLYASDEEYDEKAVESIMYLLDKWEPLEEGAVPPVDSSAAGPSAAGFSSGTAFQRAFFQRRAFFSGFFDCSADAAGASGASAVSGASSAFGASSTGGASGRGAA